MEWLTTDFYHGLNGLEPEEMMVSELVNFVCGFWGDSHLFCRQERRVQNKCFGAFLCMRSSQVHWKSDSGLVRSDSGEKQEFSRWKMGKSEGLELIGTRVIILENQFAMLFAGCWMIGNGCYGE